MRDILYKCCGVRVLADRELNPWQVEKVIAVARAGGVHTIRVRGRFMLLTQEDQRPMASPFGSAEGQSHTTVTEEYIARTVHPSKETQ